MDEETVSVTSSSQVSAGRVRPPQWNVGEEDTKEGTRGPPEDPSDPSGGRSTGDGRRGPWGHRGQRGRTGPQEGMEQWDLWDLLGQGDSQGGMGYPPPGAHLLPRDWAYPLYSMLT